MHFHGSEGLLRDPDYLQFKIWTQMLSVL